MTVIYTLRVAALMALLIWTGYSFGEPTHKASGSGIEVVVYSEPCAFKEVAIFPSVQRGTEGSKVYEGCGGFHPSGVALFYFSDRSVVALPVQWFVLVVGA